MTADKCCNPVCMRRVDGWWAECSIAVSSPQFSLRHTQLAASSVLHVINSERGARVVHYLQLISLSIMTSTISRNDDIVAPSQCHDIITCRSLRLYRWSRSYDSGPTSVASERVFSLSGRVMTRNRLLPETATCLAFPNKNLDVAE